MKVLLSFLCLTACTMPGSSSTTPTLFGDYQPWTNAIGLEVRNEDFAHRETIERKVTYPTVDLASDDEIVRRTLLIDISGDAELARSHYQAQFDRLIGYDRTSELTAVGTDVTHCFDSGFLQYGWYDEPDSPLQLMISVRRDPSSKCFVGTSP